MITNGGLRYRRAARALALLAMMVVGGALAIGVDGDAESDGHVDVASAATRIVNARQEVSSNWAGYVVNDSAGTSFKSVSGNWTQPAVSPSSGDGYSSFWVGLGGSSDGAQELEQVGTAADVVNGQTQYYAWYELVPDPETRLQLTVNPGDRMAATVAVNGTDVAVSLSDQTSGQSFSKTMQMSNPDRSSAEWIAEAPSVATDGSDAQTLPLANFGTVRFANASATAGSHTGSISDAQWTAKEVRLDPAAGAGHARAGGGPAIRASTQGTGGASPSSLSSDGSSFSVSYTPGGGGGQPSNTGLAEGRPASRGSAGFEAG